MFNSRTSSEVAAAAAGARRPAETAAGVSGG